GFESQTAMISGVTSRSSSSSQRLVMARLSRPIRPPPMMPKRMVSVMRRSSASRLLQPGHGIFRRRAVVDDGHEGPGHGQRVLVLDDISPVDDARGSLKHEVVGAAENLLFGGPAAATNQDGPPSGRLDHAWIVGHIAGRVRFAD